MTSNMNRQSSYLRTSRNFPTKAFELSVELDKTYIDIANAVNNRTIGTFPINFPVVNGEEWYVTSSNKRREVLRQVYMVSGTGNIPHGIDVSTIGGFVRIYGTFVDNTTPGGPYWFPLPYTNEILATNQVALYVGPTNIVITAGGASPPTVDSGFVVLEWISAI